MQVNLMTYQGCQEEKHRLIEMIVLGLLFWVMPFTALPWTFIYVVWMFGVTWMINYTSAVIHTTKMLDGTDVLMTVITSLLWPIIMPIVGVMRLVNIEPLIKRAREFPFVKVIKIHTVAYYKNSPNLNGIIVDHDDYEKALNDAIKNGTAELKLSSHMTKDNTTYGKITYSAYNVDLDRFEMIVLMEKPLPADYYSRKDTTGSVPVFASFFGDITTKDGQQYSTCTKHSGYYLDGQLRPDHEECK